jgi:hypothetical protein
MNCLRRMEYTDPCHIICGEFYYPQVGFVRCEAPETVSNEPYKDVDPESSTE